MIQLPPDDNSSDDDVMWQGSETTYKRQPKFRLSKGLSKRKTRLPRLVTPTPPNTPSNDRKVSFKLSPIGKSGFGAPKKTRNIRQVGHNVTCSCS